MGTVEGEEGRQAARAVSWLDDGQVRSLFKRLIHEDDVAGRQILHATPPCVDRQRMSPQWRDALLDALDARINPDADDPDDVVTTIIPRYTEFAEDQR